MYLLHRNTLSMPTFVKRNHFSILEIKKDIYAPNNENKIRFMAICFTSNDPKKTINRIMEFKRFCPLLCMHISSITFYIQS